MYLTTDEKMAAGSLLDWLLIFLRDGHREELDEILCSGYACLQAYQNCYDISGGKELVSKCLIDISKRFEECANELNHI